MDGRGIAINNSEIIPPELVSFDALRLAKPPDNTWYALREFATVCAERITVAAAQKPSRERNATRVEANAISIRGSTASVHSE